MDEFHYKYMQIPAHKYYQFPYCSCTLSSSIVFHIASPHPLPAATSSSTTATTITSQANKPLLPDIISIQTPLKKEVQMTDESMAERPGDSVFTSEEAVQV